MRCDLMRTAADTLTCQRDDCGRSIKTPLRPDSVSLVCRSGQPDARPAKVPRPSAAEVMTAKIEQRARECAAMGNVDRAAWIRRRWALCNTCTPADLICPLVDSGQPLDQRTPCAERTQWARLVTMGWSDATPRGCEKLNAVAPRSPAEPAANGDAAR